MEANKKKYFCVVVVIEPPHPNERSIFTSDQTKGRKIKIKCSFLREGGKIFHASGNAAQHKHRVCIQLC